MGVFQNNLLAGAAAAASAGASGFYSYQIEQSARFDRASSSYLSRTIQSGGNLDAWTFSFWCKMTASSGFGSNQYYILTAKDNGVGSYDTLIFDVNANSQIYYQIANYYKISNNAIRDTGGWSHFVFIYNSANGTMTNRRRFYLNGTEMTPSDEQSLGQNVDSQINDNSVHYIGARQDLGSSYYADYYMAEVIFTDGQMYEPTQFGESKNGVWVPKDPSGTSFGTTGYHLKFENASDLGNDSSGNNNDWTANNMGADHQVLDSPTTGAGS